MDVCDFVRASVRAGKGRDCDASVTAPAHTRNTHAHTHTHTHTRHIQVECTIVEHPLVDVSAAQVLVASL